MIHSRIMKHKFSEKIIGQPFLERINANGAIFLLVTTILIVSCVDMEQSLDDRIKTIDLQSLPPVRDPDNNPTTPEKAELGRLLFYDPIISGERNISCFSCHIPEHGYAEPIELSKGPGGVGLGLDRTGGRPDFRNSTGVIYSAYVGLRDADQFYDPLKAAMTWTVNLRALEPQAMAGAMINPRHMRGSGNYNAATVGDTITIRLKKIAEYITLFDGAFGGGQESINGVNIGKALGAFQRSLAINNSHSPYDHYASGDIDALTEQQKEGLLLFFGKANCSTCHGGPMFSDFSLYNLGIKDHPNVNPKDKGAGGKRLFKTPSLRNVELTWPYMHNGTITSLRGVLEFYNKGISENDSVPQSQMSIKIKPLNLTNSEIDALHAFLKALTDESFDMEIPSSVPSGLKVGGD